ANSLVSNRVSVLQIFGHVVHIRARLLHADARLEPAYSMKSQPGAAIRKNGIAPLSNRRVDIYGSCAVGRKTKISRHHTDDGETLAIQSNALANDVRRRSKLTLPQSGADQDYRRRADLLFSGRQVASKHGLDSEHGQQVRRDEQCL